MMTGFDTDSERQFATAGATAAEAVDNIDTVSALGVQDYFMDKYKLALKEPLRIGRRKAMITGAGFAFSEFSQFSIWAVALYVIRLFFMGPVRLFSCTARDGAD